jgi:hypothetical protein
MSLQIVQQVSYSLSVLEDVCFVVCRAEVGCMMMILIAPSRVSQTRIRGCV